MVALLLYATSYVPTWSYLDYYSLTYINHAWLASVKMNKVLFVKHGDTNFDRSSQTTVEAKRVRVIVSGFEHCYSTPHVAPQIVGVVDPRHIVVRLSAGSAGDIGKNRKAEHGDGQSWSGGHGPILILTATRAHGPSRRNKSGLSPRLSPTHPSLSLPPTPSPQCLPFSPAEPYPSPSVPHNAMLSRHASAAPPQKFFLTSRWRTRSVWFQQPSPRFFPALNNFSLTVTELVRDGLLSLS